MTALRKLRLGRGLRLVDITVSTRIATPQLSGVECRTLAASKNTRAKLAALFGVEQAAIFEPGGLALEE